MRINLSKIQLKKKSRLILIYFGIISILFLVQIFNCRERNFEIYKLGVSPDDTYELVDGKKIETSFRITKDNPIGITFNDFYCNGIEYTDERLNFDFYDGATEKLIQKSAVALKDQIDGTNIYIKFDGAIPKGTQLKICIYSEGVGSTGPLLGLSESFEIGNVTREQQRLSEKYLCASICYEYVEWNILQPILFLVAETVIGLILFGMSKEYKREDHTKKEAKERKKRNSRWWLKKLIEVVVMVGVLIVFFDFIYYKVIEKNINKRDCEVVTAVESKDTYNVNYDSEILLKNGDEVSQVFKTSKDHLSGYGIYISDNLDSEAVLGCKLYDLTSGKLLLAKRYKISDLPSASSYVTKNLNTSKECVFIDFQDIFQASEGKYYKISLQVESEETLLLGVNKSDNFPMSKNSELIGNSMTSLAFYSNNYFIKEMFMVIVVLLIVSFVSIYVVISLGLLKVEGTFAVCALVLGIVFCCLIPPYCVPDERAHIDSAYKISNQLLGIEETSGPARILKRKADIDSTKENTMDVTLERYRELYEAFQNFVVEEDEKELVEGYAFDAISNATVFNYLPTAIGFALGRLIGVNYIIMIIIGRICNLICTILLMYVAIKKIPFGKSVFAVVGILPMSLQQAASCSYDGILLGGAFIFIAYCFRYVYIKEKSFVDILVLEHAGCFLAACKGGVYLPILGLLLCLLISENRIKMKNFFRLIAMYFPMGVFFLAQYSSRILKMLGKVEESAYRPGTGNEVSLYTFSYLLENPKKLIRLYQNTFSVRGDPLLAEILGSRLGRLNISVPWYVLIGFIIILVLCTFKEKKDDFYINKFGKISICTLCGLSTMLIMLSMLLAWTTLGAEYIEGLQGRYFLPLVGLLILCMRNTSLIYEKKSSLRLVWMAGILNIFTVGNAMLSIL